MYNVKVNGNYNVLINDINVYVSTTHVHGVDINEKAYKSSKDVQSLLKAGIIIVNPAGSKEAKATTKAVVVEAKSEKAFVKEVAVQTVPENVFVAQPAEEVVKVEETKVEDVKVEETKEVEVPATEEKKVVAKAEKAPVKKAEKPATKKSNKNTKGAK